MNISNVSFQNQMNKVSTSFVKEVTYLFYVIEIGFHTLYCNLFVCFNLLGLEHFRESSFTLFGNEAVLYSIKLQLLEISRHIYCLHLNVLMIAYEVRNDN